MSRHRTRFLPFDITKGLEITVGKAVEGDPNRSPKVDNLLFYDEDLDYDHANLIIKILDHEGSGEHSNSILDSVRIYLEDLDSKFGIVDLESANSDGSDKIIDLKDGDRFGLIKLDASPGKGQIRGAKVKLRLSLHQSQMDPCKWVLVVKDVSCLSSPCTSRSDEFVSLEVKGGSFTPSSISKYEKGPVPKRSHDLISERTRENATSINVGLQDMEDWVNPSVVSEPLCSLTSLGQLPEASPTLKYSKFDSLCRTRESHTQITNMTNNEDSSQNRGGYRRNSVDEREIFGGMGLTIQETDAVSSQSSPDNRYSLVRKTRKGEQDDPPTLRLNEGQRNPKRRKIDYYSGSLGILVGAIGTLSALSILANVREM